MKKISFLFLIVFCNFISCSKSETAPVNENENLAPSDFAISIDEVSDKSAAIVWAASNDPENNSVTYTLFLGDSLLLTNTTSLSYSFEDLAPQTSYSVRIEASDGTNSTFSNFTFTTSELVPVPFAGDMILVSQQEVIDFGEQGYTEISGSLTIRDSGSFSDFYITDLTPLTYLTKIDGNLRIEMNYRLKNLEGLNHLTSIDGEFIIKNNFELMGLQGLEGLISVGADLEVTGNSELIDVDGLINLNSVGGNLGIASSPVTSLKGLSSLTHIGLNLYIIDIEVTNMEGLEGIALLERNLNISDCNKLESLIGFDNLTDVKARVYISDNDSLINLEGLGKLKTIGDIFEINANTSLKNLDGIESLTTVWFFEIRNNNQLENIDGLANLSSVTHNLNISHNQALVDLCGIRPFLSANVTYSQLSINNNGYNPFQQQIIDGNCSQ